MPDVLDANGLQIADFTEIRAALVAGFQSIYGTDINVSQNSPDGQQINIYAQAGVDLREVLQKIYNSFNPDLAEGVVLDQRLALFNIKRKQGTFTFQDIEITTDRALNLVGLDGDANELEPEIENLYSVKDNAGSIFYLLSSQIIAAPGTYTYTFRAKALGVVETLPNTIQTAETVIAGVTNINNPSSANSVGKNEETDIEAKLRAKKSTSLSAIGPLDSLEAALNNIDLVTTAIVYENITNSVDGDGIPAHGIWCIVEGGDPDDIGDIIYRKRIMGVDMKGAQTVPIARPNSDIFTAKFDRPISQDLWIRFSITLPGGFVDETGIKNLITQNVFWDIGKDATADVITTYLKNLNSDYVIEDMEISDDDITYVEVVSPTSKQYRFINAVARITIL